MIALKDKRVLPVLSILTAVAGIALMAWSRYLTLRIMYSLTDLADLLGYLLPRNYIKVAFTRIILFAGLGLIYLALVLYNGKGSISDKDARSG